MMRTVRSFPLCRFVAAALLIAAPASGQLRRDRASALTDAEFWQIFTTMSEPGGTFASENFVSNEMTFQFVIPTLQKTVRADGAYLGVGPEQNFTYIANLKPSLAIIFDIRRQNAMAHLMYKAMFELSPTRADFVSRLFSRPLAARVATTAKVDDLFAVATSAVPSDSAFAANQRLVFAQLVDKHRFALTPGDSAAIEHLLEVFYYAGPDLNYGYRMGRGSTISSYPTYGMLQTRVNADSVQMAFLANEENYRAVRDMHMHNLIVPVVGDFAGPKAIRAVGDYLRKRNLTVQAFYLSNVEQYLFGNTVADRFYQNVATLPIDSTSMFIRSVPPGAAHAGGSSYFVRQRLSIGGANGSITFGNGVTNSFMSYDSAGVRWLRTTQDSAGMTVSRLYRDSSGVYTLQRSDSGRSTGQLPQPPGGVRAIPMPNPAPPAPAVVPFNPRTMMGGSLLVSGVAPIGRTLEAFNAGGAASYAQIIAMTKLDGWK
jgi:hypothetical protein